MYRPKRERIDDIFNAYFLIAILILILNDFVFKQAFGNWFTGKLSDFVGLYAFAYFWGVVFKKKWKKAIYISIAVMFVYWKSPFSETLIVLWNSYAPYNIGRVIDYSDLIALVVLPFGYFHHAREKKVVNSMAVLYKVGRPVIVSFTIFTFLATSGTEGKIKRYTFHSSKRKVYDAIVEFKRTNANFNVPNAYSGYLWKPVKMPDGSEPIDARHNADSVSFYFYIPDENLIIHSSFYRLESNWDKDECSLDLIKFVYPPGVYQINLDVTSQEEREVEKLFEDQILDALLLYGVEYE